MIIKQAKKNYYHQQFKENKSNSKKMWELLKKCTTGSCLKTELPNTFFMTMACNLKM